MSIGRDSGERPQTRFDNTPIPYDLFFKTLPAVDAILAGVDTIISRLKSAPPEEHLGLIHELLPAADPLVQMAVVIHGQHGLVATIGPILHVAIVLELCQSPDMDNYTAFMTKQISALHRLFVSLVPQVQQRLDAEGNPTPWDSPQEV